MDSTRGKGSTEGRAGDVTQQKKMSPENRLKTQGPTRLYMQEFQKSTTLKTSKYAQDLVQNCVDLWLLWTSNF